MAMNGRSESSLSGLSPSGQAMMQECQDKEAAVRELANDYYRKAHR